MAKAIIMSGGQRFEAETGDVPLDLWPIINRRDHKVPKKKKVIQIKRERIGVRTGLTVGAC